nr:MAG TPA: hypothetical protein [Caudoviricetes sp.]
MLFKSLQSYLLANQRTRRRLLPVPPKIHCAYVVTLHIFTSKISEYHSHILTYSNLITR